MKKMMVLGLMFLLAFSFVSAIDADEINMVLEEHPELREEISEYVEIPVTLKANVAVAEKEYAKTIVLGKITHGRERVRDAEVKVTCSHEGIAVEPKSLHVWNGFYWAKFSQKERDSLCFPGDLVSVEVVKDDLVGTGASDSMSRVRIINIKMSSIPVVPEFGFVVGILTILSAVGVFMMVRRG